MAHYVTIVRGVALLALLTAPLACQAALRDLCEDGGSCLSDPECPIDPPSHNVRCELDDGALCFFCLEDERADATQFECDHGGATPRWKRRENIDCGD